jgi:hypothetical protein
VKIIKVMDVLTLAIHLGECERRSRVCEREILQGDKGEFPAENYSISRAKQRLNHSATQRSHTW